MQLTPPSELSQEDRTKINDFLDSHPIGVLATVDASGNPHASTIYFSVDSDLNLTFTTKRDTDKSKNIAFNPKVMLDVYDSESQASVQASGTAIEVTDPEAAQKIYHGTLRAAKQTNEDPVPPIAKIAAGPYVAYQIKPENIWLSEYGWGNDLTNALSKLGEPVDNEDPA